jgi:hypothetical protein
VAKAIGLHRNGMPHLLQPLRDVAICKSQLSDAFSPSELPSPQRGFRHLHIPAIINEMSLDCDAAEEFQLASYSVNSGRVLAALPGLSTAVSGQFAIAAPSFSLW